MIIGNVTSTPSELKTGQPIRRDNTGLWLALLLLICYSYFFPRWADWGVNSKMDLTLAIVDEGTFAIDHYYQNTGDYAVYKGHYYSDKAPGASFLAVPVYAAFKAVVGTSLLDPLIDGLARNPAMLDTLRQEGTGLLTDKVYFAMALYGVTFFVMALPSAVLGYILYQFLGYFIQNRRARALIIILYGLGTIAFPYSQTLNGRQVSACLTMAAFYMLFRMKRGELSQRYLWLVGLLMGYVVITDYPSVLILLALFAYAVSFLRSPRRVLPLILAGIPPVVLLAAYNLSIFETPLPVGYKYSALYQDLHSQGLISITYPRLETMYGLTFSPFRGLFFISPALLLAVPGFVYWFRQRRWRAEWWVCFGSVISSFLFYASSVMWWGGFAVGPAYLAAMIPYLVIPLAFFADRHGQSKKMWLVLIGLMAASVVLVWAQTIAGQSFPDLTPDPLFSLSIPALMAGDIARNLGMLLKLRGPLSLVPLTVMALAVLLIILRTNRATGIQRHRLATEAAHD
ncbi:MAG TPA: hypothetical protein VIK33_12175 [Anaerolineae bacterium]